MADGISAVGETAAGQPGAAKIMRKTFATGVHMAAAFLQQTGGRGGVNILGMRQAAAAAFCFLHRGRRRENGSLRGVAAAGRQQRLPQAWRCAQALLSCGSCTRAALALMLARVRERRAGAYSHPLCVRGVAPQRRARAAAAAAGASVGGMFASPSLPVCTYISTACCGTASVLRFRTARAGSDVRVRAACAGSCAGGVARYREKTREKRPRGGMACGTCGCSRGRGIHLQDERRLLAKELTPPACLPWLATRCRGAWAHLARLPPQTAAAKAMATRTLVSVYADAAPVPWRLAYIILGLGWRRKNRGGMAARGVYFWAVCLYITLSRVRLRQKNSPLSSRLSRWGCGSAQQGGVMPFGCHGGGRRCGGSL